MNNKLLITKLDDMIVSTLYENHDMVQVSIEHVDESRILGNIYIGKVKNIVKNINAAFVEIAGGTMCYLSLGEVKNPIFTNHKKNNNLVVGDELIVQIEKEGIKSKAPVVTTNINFTGKYVVLIHGKANLGISSKITAEKERLRIKDRMELYKNEQYGFIVRTNAMHAPDDIINAEVSMLIKDYEDLIQYGIHKSVFSLLRQNIPGFISDIKDGYGNLIDEIITDDKGIFDIIKEYLSKFQSEDLTKLHYYEDKLISLANLYSMRTKLESALKEKVWLKSGGTIIIQPTEALTVIDVNTGKAIAGKKNSQETFYKVNKEAAIEIAKQIRLRNLSGIIIIDFISMDNKEYKDNLVKELDYLLRKDPIKTTVVDMTALDLVEITRKKVRKPLLEQMKKGIKDREIDD